MPQGIPDARNLLWVEGQAISLTFTRTSSTAGTLTWTLPANPVVYNGILITASLSEMNPSNYPTDTVRYDASSDLSVTADQIGLANVVVALYDDKTTTTATLTNLQADAPYYFSAHVVSNVNTYYTFGVKSYPDSVGSEVYAGDIQKLYGPPDSPVVGQVYYDEVQKYVFVWDGSTWMPTSSTTVLTGPVDPVSPFTGLPEGYPVVGDFFYNTVTKTLKIWNGTVWNSAEAAKGIPSYDKQGVGTTMEYSARSYMIDILKKQLGWPVVCVELIEDHFTIAINNALQEFRRRADSAYTKQYFFMTIHKFQDVYYLNDPTTETDKIVDVLKIHRLNLLGLVNFAPDNIYAQQFLNHFYAPGVSYDLVSIHLIHSMSEIYSLLFAGEVAFNWREASRELRIYKKFSVDEKVLIETSCEKTEQELLVDRWAQQWIQQWAEAELMFILAHIRGKYASLPGPGGGLQLNADSLLSEGQRLQDDCLRQIREYEVGQNGPDNWYSPIVIG